MTADQTGHGHDLSHCLVYQQTRIYEAEYETEHNDHKHTLLENRRLRKKKEEMRQQVALLQEQVAYARTHARTQRRDDATRPDETSLKLKRAFQRSSFLMRRLHLNEFPCLRAEQNADFGACVAAQGLRRRFPPGAVGQADAAAAAAEEPPRQQRAGVDAPLQQRAAASWGRQADEERRDAAAASSSSSLPQKPEQGQRINLANTFIKLHHGEQYLSHTKH